MPLASEIALAEDFRANGFLRLRGVLSGPQLAPCERGLEALRLRSAGRRALLDEPWCREIADFLRVAPRLSTFLADTPRLVQAIAFDKAPGRNWLVAFHQDLSIPVAERIDAPELHGWSLKNDVLHVQPPVDVLRKLVAVRLHLDDCDESNGTLRVLPGSHELGRIAPDLVPAMRQELGEVTCVASRGDALVMSPLLLHASSKSRSGLPRRVLHLVFGPAEPPFGLRWATA